VVENLLSPSAFVLQARRRPSLRLLFPICPVLKMQVPLLPSSPISNDKPVVVSVPDEKPVVAAAASVVHPQGSAAAAASDASDSKQEEGKLGGQKRDRDSSHSEDAEEGKSKRALKRQRQQATRKKVAETFLQSDACVDVFLSTGINPQHLSRDEVVKLARSHSGAAAAAAAKPAPAPAADGSGGGAGSGVDGFWGLAI
jgi:hypothetical protein